MSKLTKLNKKLYKSILFQDYLKVIDSISRKISVGDWPLSQLGYCYGCEQNVPFDIRANFGVVANKTGKFHLALSETCVCPVCRINSRMRFAMEWLREKSESESNIYLTEKSTHLFEVVKKKYSYVIGSEYIENYNSGDEVNGILVQNIESTSFEDNKFDFILSLDVLEHVPNPHKAIYEIYRILRPGGSALITFPFFPNNDYTVKRAEFIDGQLVHHEPDVYHGNPAGTKSLVFNDISWDFIDVVNLRLENSVSLYHYYSSTSLHLGVNRFFMQIDKLP